MVTSLPYSNLKRNKEQDWIDGYTSAISKIEYVFGRIFITNTQLQNLAMRLISACAPEDDEPAQGTFVNQKSIRFMKVLSAEYMYRKDKEKIILMGDSNARIGNHVIPGIVQKYNK